MSDIKDKIRHFVVYNYLFGDQGNLEDESSLMEEGILDSTGVMELIEFVEKEFGFTVAEKEIVQANLDSINNLESYVIRKTQHAA